MVDTILSLDPAARHQRLSIRYGQHGHIDDEVVVTLLLDAWGSGQNNESEAYASELLRRVTLQVRAHVRKNPVWHGLGGGAENLIDEFCSEIVLSILQNTKTPCHAEIAFGDYVYKRCLDESAKLYAKKRSAGVSLDAEDSEPETLAQISDPNNSTGAIKSPEQFLMEIEDLLADQDKLAKISQILENDVPEKPRVAFTFRFFGQMKIGPTTKDEITVSSLMGVGGKTTSKYINQAIDIIKKGLSYD